MENTYHSPYFISEKLPQILKAQSRSLAKARAEMSFSDLWICVLTTWLGSFYCRSKYSIFIMCTAAQSSKLEAGSWNPLFRAAYKLKLKI